MKHLTCVATALLTAVLPAWGQVAQDSEVDRLKKTIDQLKADYEAQRLALQQLLKEREAQLKDLELKLSRGAAAAAPVTPSTPATDATAPAPGRVMAVASDLGLVIVSLGKERNVSEGATLAVIRDKAYIGKIAVQRVETNWALGRVVEATAPYRVGDEVRIMVTGGFGSEAGTSAPAPKVEPSPRYGAAPGPMTRESADELRAIRRELDDMRTQVRALSDRLVPAWHDDGVAVEELSDDLRAHLGIEKGLVVRRVREGSAAEKAGLRTHDVLPGLTEADLIKTLRAGAPLKIIRQGRALPGEGAPKR